MEELLTTFSGTESDVFNYCNTRSQKDEKTIKTLKLVE